jgi:hypothetical protein
MEGEKIKEEMTRVWLHDRAREILLSLGAEWRTAWQKILSGGTCSAKIIARRTWDIRSEQFGPLDLTRGDKARW